MPCEECAAAWRENQSLLEHRAECYEIIAKREDEIARLNFENEQLRKYPIKFDTVGRPL